MRRKRNKQADKDKKTPKNAENGGVDAKHSMTGGDPPNNSTNNRKVNSTKTSKNKTSSSARSQVPNAIPPQANGCSSGGGAMHKSPSASTLSRMERQNVVLWKRPFQTLQYFILEVFNIIWNFLKSFFCIRRLFLTILFFSSAACLYLIPGHHTKYLVHLEKKLLWCLYWIGLGVLSSVGLGTGLHTFILYLGPHIARVTLAAFECNSLDFPEPPYPDDVTCPTSADALVPVVSLMSIIGKVRLESFMWGAGTALGELPPYFMAKAARLSGKETDDEEYNEFISFVEGDLPKQMSMMDKVKLWMERVVTRVGFLGILLFASIPNPFFDLAGITCGHFLIPFWTFFGATLIGKALVKMHVQMLFVVITFSEHHVEHLVNLLKEIPRVGPFLQAPLKEFLQAQKLRLHRQPDEPVPEQASSLLQQAMSYVVTAMIICFVVSLINSLAQRYHKRICEEECKGGKKQSSKVKTK